MPFYSPLRYPGGKGRLGRWFATLLRSNKISGGWYAEPYAGGGGVALQLLLEGYVSHVLINDIDYSVFAFWKAVVGDTEEFLHRLGETPVTLEQRKEQIDVLQNPDKHSILDIGFACFFVNRTSRSGILSGGAIGGSQNGKWKLNARFNKDDLSKRIRLIGKYSKNIEIYNKDASLFINEIMYKSGKGLIYLDPPYYHKSGELYKNTYDIDDHNQLSQIVKKINLPWVVTYDDCREIESMYSWARGGRFPIYYSASQYSRGRKNELMFYGNVSLPCSPYLKR